MTGIRNCTLSISEEVLQFKSGVSLPDVENKGSIYLKSFVKSLPLEYLEELVMVSQLGDYIDDNVLITKSTYEKMSKEQLTRQIKSKYLY